MYTPNTHIHTLKTHTKHIHTQHTHTSYPNPRKYTHTKYTYKTHTKHINTHTYMAYTHTLYTHRERAHSRTSWECGLVMRDLPWSFAGGGLLGALWEILGRGPSEAVLGKLKPEGGP